MVYSVIRSAVVRRASLLTACVALAVITQSIGAGKAPMRTRKYDPVAEKVELFAGLEAKQISARIVANDSKGGNIYFENLTNKPLTIQLPPSAVMVHVLKQVGNGSNLFGNTNGGFNGLGQQGGIGGQQGGGAQSLGSGFGQQNNQFGNNQQGLNNGINGQNIPLGNGFFSIPAERVFQLPFQSACLDYGKDDPAPRMTYKFVPVESYTKDKILQETLTALGNDRIPQSVVQAAVWHQANKLSWDKIAGLGTPILPGSDALRTPMFSQAELQAARQLLTHAIKRAEEREKQEAAEKANRAVAKVDGKLIEVRAAK